MTKPRRALGSQLPGRLLATRLRVLAAEMSDAGRLSRGKAYWAEGAVVDIEVTGGKVAGTVQGSRRTPYHVTLEADVGHGMPMRREVFVECTCPDDDGTGRYGCKHVVAVLFQLSEEVSIDPDLIALWRRSDMAPTADDASGDDDEDDDDEGHSTLATVVPIRPTTRTREAPPSRTVPSPPERPRHLAVLDELVLAPAGSTLPPLPELGQLVHPPTGNLHLDEVLADALTCCQIWWR